MPANQRSDCNKRQDDLLEAVIVACETCNPSGWPQGCLEFFKVGTQASVVNLIPFGCHYPATRYKNNRGILYRGVKFTTLA